MSSELSDAVKCLVDNGYVSAAVQLHLLEEHYAMHYGTAEQHIRDYQSSPKNVKQALCFLEEFFNASRNLDSSVKDKLRERAVAGFYFLQKMSLNNDKVDAHYL